jgi:hypothetical protein
LKRIHSHAQTLLETTAKDETKQLGELMLVRIRKSFMLVQDAVAEFGQKAQSLLDNWAEDLKSASESLGGTWYVLHEAAVARGALRLPAPAAGQLTREGLLWIDLAFTQGFEVKDSQVELGTAGEVLSSVGAQTMILFVCPATAGSVFVEQKLLERLTQHGFRQIARVALSLDLPVTAASDESNSPDCMLSSLLLAGKPAT